MTASVVVLGSANLDLVYAVDRIPAPGETVLATGQQRHPGGKGLNQAVAAARAGAGTAFLGAVGTDEAADTLAGAMRAAGVDADCLRRVDGASGTALITVAADGENSIVVAAGANGSLDALRPAERTAIEATRVLVMQLEIPLPVVTEAARVARAAGRQVVLNAAPATTLARELLDLVNVLVVNEHEARVLTGAGRDDDPVAAAGRLVGTVGSVVVTLGARGAVWISAAGSGECAPPRVQVVDTTGAGDTFTGYLAAGLAAGLPLRGAVARAVVAGALSAEQPGAVPSVPTAEAVERRMSEVAP